MIDPHIIDKIKKLRALTEERGATEDEALLAQERIFALLAKHNLELNQIPDDDPSTPDTKIEEEKFELPSNRWKQVLYTHVCNLNFSECFVWHKQIYIVGTKANRIATIEMASYLIETIERLADDAANQVAGDQRRSFRHSFAEGCAHRICRRLKALRLEAEAGRMKAADPNSLLPALADLYQSNQARMDDFITAHFGRISHRTYYSSVGDRSGYRAGHAAGDKVGLHRQVGKNARQLLLAE